MQVLKSSELGDFVDKIPIPACVLTQNLIIQFDAGFFLYAMVKLTEPVSITQEWKWLSLLLLATSGTLLAKMDGWMDG